VNDDCGVRIRLTIGWEKLYNLDAGDTANTKKVIIKWRCDILGIIFSFIGGDRTPYQIFHIQFRLR
jgi:hypothetical protein